MTQDRFELKENGKYISTDRLRELAIKEIVSELTCMDEDDALYLSNRVRYLEDYDRLYKNDSEGVNEALDGWTPWDCLREDYDSYASYFYMDCGMTFTDDVWDGLDEEEIADNILNGCYVDYLTDDISEILNDYDEAKDFLEGLNPYRIEGEELIAKFTNCEADVTDLLQYISKLVKNDDGEVWKEEE